VVERIDRGKRHAEGGFKFLNSQRKTIQKQIQNSRIAQGRLHAHELQRKLCWKAAVWICGLGVPGNRAGAISRAASCAIIFRFPTTNSRWATKLAAATADMKLKSAARRQRRTQLGQRWQEVAAAARSASTAGLVQPRWRPGRDSFEMKFPGRQNAGTARAAQKALGPAGDFKRTSIDVEEVKRAVEKL